tara:strand:+ start:23 stop:535 length:513 start_codon:yes stop_codon:yes gene_type:complete
MSFAEQLADISIKRAKVLQDYRMQQVRQFMQAKDERENQLMTFLTKKYHKSIKDALYRAALIDGLREKYMNFDYNDFKANFPDLGNPKEVCQRWLGEMTNPNSKYLPYKTPEYFESQYETHFDSLAASSNALAAMADGQYSVSEPAPRDHFSGLQFDVWNNAAFTVKFTW